MIGKRGFIDRTSNVQIVDWRNAPVSRVYYRYEEGDDYEEEFARQVAWRAWSRSRRNVSIAQAATCAGSARRRAPILKDARPAAWVQAVGQLDAGAARRHGQGRASRRGQGRSKGTLGVHHGVARADKVLPEIAALIDNAQFELISQPSERASW
jgi:DNA helicase-2/ATP-dependent DNA helicase PcrA